MSEREEIVLNHVLGKSYGVNLTNWERFESWVQANLRLGRSMTISIDRHGDAVCESWERDT